MYVCICNGISDAKLLEAAREGGGTVEEIYANLGAQPQCRKCVPHVERILGLGPDGGLPQRAAPDDAEASSYRSVACCVGQTS